MEKFSTKNREIAISLEFVEVLSPFRSCGWCGQPVPLNPTLVYEYTVPDAVIKITNVPGYACDNCETTTYTTTVANLISDRIDRALE